jgi:hypothetical protein
MDSYAPNWTDEEREQYKRDYIAEKPVLRALLEHDDDECEHCKLLRQLQREADEQSDQEISVDPAVAKRVVDERWPEDAGGMARNSIRDEDLVAAHLWARDAGITHDEKMVEIYDRMTEQS